MYTIVYNRSILAASALFITNFSQLLDWQLPEHWFRDEIGKIGDEHLMRNFIAGLLTFASLTLAGPVGAQSNHVLVELYTSQGCSSCPPADALLKQLDERDGVIALALHVDYWDYIGWKDSFGDHKYTLRQEAYAYAAGRNVKYTPQFIVGGTAAVVGSRPIEVADLINAMQVQDHGVRMTLERKGDKLEISARMLGKHSQQMIVQLVRYHPSQSVSIQRGENAGRTIEYVNIVTEWRQIGAWDGKNPLKLRENVQGPLPVVVILQAVGPGQVLAAARLR